MRDGTAKLVVEGKRRAKIRRFLSSEPFFLVEYDEIDESEGTASTSVEVEALMRSVKASFERYYERNEKIEPEVLIRVQAIDDPARLADIIAANLPTIKLADRQALLETVEAKKRLERIIELM